MPLLIIERNAHVEREVEIPTELRIGRDELNDVVLDDPDRGVSRFHAEIRYENGGYVLVDLDSRNGTWIEGERITTCRLEPGVKVRIGPYELGFQPDQSEAAAPPPEAAANGYTVFDPALAAQRPAEEPAPVPTPVPPPRPVAVPRRRQGVVFVAATIVVIAVAGFVMLRRTANPPQPSPPPAQEPAAADRQRADVTTQLAEAKRLLATGDAEAARHVIDAVLAADPANHEAALLRDQVVALAAQPKPEQPSRESGPTPDPPRRERRAPKAAVVADANDVPRRPDESQADWEARNRRVRDHYAAAKAAMSAEDGVLAISHLDQIDRDQPGYLESASMRVSSGLLVGAQARRTYDAGVRAEQAKEWATAIRDYERAHELDSSLNVTERITVARGHMTAEGREILVRARNLDAFGGASDAEIIKLYEQALALLPAADPQRAEATRRLQVLRSKR